MKELEILPAHYIVGFSILDSAMSHLVDDPSAFDVLHYSCDSVCKELHDYCRTPRRLRWVLERSTSLSSYSPFGKELVRDGVNLKEVV